MEVSPHLQQTISRFAKISVSNIPPNMSSSADDKDDEAEEPESEEELDDESDEDDE
jgi:hypothetical protein